jgi:acetyltransferase-like isoleucine patch superfamily enzyme/dTDP-4-dehydrorhamnose 3,5-epimerase-like enzyme
MSDPSENQAETEAVGARTRIHTSAQVLGARIGADCDIGAGAFVESGAIVGDRVVVERGAQLWSGTELEDDVSIGPDAIFTATAASLPDAGPGAVPGTIVRAGASVGANATILGGLEVGRGAQVGAGAVVTESIPPHAVVTGNPARIHGYIDSGPSTAKGATQADGKSGTTPLGVRGVHLQRFDEFSDLRGRLTAGDMPSEGVPFVPQRWFLVYDVPSREVRGAHAHRVCHQFLICVSGHVHVAVDDGEQRGEVLLDDPTMGLYVPPLVWASQYRYDEQTVLLALASHPYDPDDYIREYDAFLVEAAGAAAPPAEAGPGS